LVFVVGVLNLVDRVDHDHEFFISERFCRRHQDRRKFFGEGLEVVGV
jgi:hypothetical protein